MTVAVAVLAAGSGTRFGGDVPKPLVPFAGRPLVTYAVDAARASGCAPVVVVVSDDAVAAVVEGVQTVRNDAPDEGIASSLRCAIAALADQAVDGVVVGLGDQPLVGGEAYRRVAAASADLAYATYAGERGNPVLVGRRYWPEAMELRGDEGARSLFRRFPAVAVPCDGTGTPDDVDTPADLAKLEHRWRSQTASE